MNKKMKSTLACMIVLVLAIPTIFCDGVEVKCTPPLNEDCISFNPGNIQVKQIKGRWKIVEGSHWMFDFGSDEGEAREAYNIIKHYRMNQSCFVGRPNASFQYLLVSGKAPVGGFPGEDCVSFNPNTIKVKKINNRWKIVDGNHMMFDFGKKKKEAKLAYCIIKKYGFNRSCFVGRPNPSFSYLKKVKAEQPCTEDCISFNPGNIQVKQINGRWKIVEGSHWMFDFGSDEGEAREAYNIIKHYGMNQSCFVRRPNASFQYLLVSGKAPVGGFPGEDCLSFNPNTIKVKKINNRWKIVDGNHWMFDFGKKKKEAELAYCIIKKYGFNRSCFVGRSGASFQYLRK
ncbi:MAG: hypothetical protein KAT34_07205 [Candidatus Aminicenantes bacterium]|nr:hypothetical protein [Candidatus Aminicenantes bacterium]